MNPSVTNLGICVRDMQRSLRFYCEALGFERAPAPFSMGPELSSFTQLPDSKVTLHFIRSGRYEIELLQVDNPGTVGDGAPHPINTLGDVHLAILVDDIDAALERVIYYGGTTQPESRMTLDLGGATPGEYVFCFDPDGVRIELLTQEMAKESYES